MKKETIPCKEIDVRPFAYAISLVDGKCTFYFGYGKKRFFATVK
jgi:hypothetical protein